MRTMDINAPLVFPVDPANRRRYLRTVRSPFNLFYRLLMLSGFLASMYAVMAYRALNKESWSTSWFIPLFFVCVFLIIWEGVLYVIRWFHLDAGIMYKRSEKLMLQKKEVKSLYTKADGNFSSAEQHIPYSAITGLTILTDSRSGLPVLQVDASQVTLRTLYETPTGATGHRLVTLQPPDSRRYFPLYYRQSEQVLQHLVSKTGLQLNNGSIDIRKLKEKRI